MPTSCARSDAVNGIDGGRSGLTAVTRILLTTLLAGCATAPRPVALVPPLESLSFDVGHWQCKGTSYATATEAEQHWNARVIARTRMRCRATPSTVQSRCGTKSARRTEDWRPRHGSRTTRTSSPSCGSPGSMRRYARERSKSCIVPHEVSQLTLSTPSTAAAASGTSVAPGSTSAGAGSTPKSGFSPSIWTSERSDCRSHARRDRRGRSVRRYRESFIATQTLGLLQSLRARSIGSIAASLEVVRAHHHRDRRRPPGHARVPRVADLRAIVLAHVPLHPIR